MCKKVFYLISFVIVLVLASNVPAETFQWDNGGDGPLWSVPENWDPDGLPGLDDDEARINLADANCVIDSSVNAECATLYVGMGEGTCYLDMTGGTLTSDGHIRVGEPGDSNGVFIMSGGTATSTNGRLWVGTNGTGAFIMRGGELNIYEKVEIGKNASGIGLVYIEGGTITFSGSSCDLEVGKYGTGTIYMTGGELNLEDNIKLAQGSTDRTDGIGRLYLYGGTINAGNLRNPADGIYGSPLMDITEGKLVLSGDYREVVNEYINRGWIIAYDNIGIVDVNYTPDPNQTTVTGRRPDPELAWYPTPRNRAEAEQDITLSWQPGIYAVSHDVYFGTDFNDVNDASRDNPLDVLLSQAQQEMTYNPGTLNLGQTYYWRIDEVNDVDPNSPWKGLIFEFTVVDYIVVDDFESYNEIPDSEPNSNLVYYTWTDGYADQSVNGAIIGYLVGNSLETETVHGDNSKQSVPLAYDNTIATYSEVTVNIDDLAISRDWTGFNVLSLWFYGGLLNSAEQMYVKLNGIKVPYGGQLTDVQQAAWQEWTTDLAAFGIDLSDVTELGIRFEKAETFGGRGTLIIDDIRLYISGAEQ